MTICFYAQWGRRDWSVNQMFEIFKREVNGTTVLFFLHIAICVLKLCINISIVAFEAMTQVRILRLA